MEDSTEKSAVLTAEKNQKKWLIFAILFIAVVIATLFFWWRFNQPSHGSINAVGIPKESVNLSDPAHRKQYQGKYFTFTYPYDFNRREENEAVNFPLLERLFLARNDIEGRKIALTLQDNSGNTFEEYGSFRIRRADPAMYQEESLERNGETIVFFTKATSVFEVSTFFHRGNQVMSITVSSPTTLNGLREEAMAVLDSFQWKNPSL